VQLKRGEKEEVYLTFSPSLERIWLESKKRFMKFADKKPANIGLRSRYALRLYDWAKKYASLGSTHITLEQLRTVLGLESVRDAAGNIIREAPLASWANFRERALNTAIRKSTPRPTCIFNSSRWNDRGRSKCPKCGNL
jgi:hypothetical protein